MNILRLTDIQQIMAKLPRIWYGFVSTDADKFLFHYSYRSVVGVVLFKGKWQLHKVFLFELMPIRWT